MPPIVRESKKTSKLPRLCMATNTTAVRLAAGPLTLISD
ncbi:hypothetical protein C900_00728 [Fulvivirga imtechensis AK7]|uniref:Uncharacterized protein n=1 Tax=Fulvivirga imtechensis AK7 TaxID=1237149 RepID=L8JL69_9BACT|nr:hypothetical protein C900_00728 [Fulvivirga imtechensis AK7]